MAKLISIDNDSYPHTARFLFMQIIFVGLITGICFWVFSTLIDIFSDSVDIIGNISTVLSIIASTSLMMRLRVAKSALISVSSGLALWGVYGWTSGLSQFEVFFWDLLLFAIACMLFFWIARCKRAVFVLIISLIVITALRVLLSY